MGPPPEIMEAMIRDMKMMDPNMKPGTAHAIHLHGDGQGHITETIEEVPMMELLPIFGEEPPMVQEQKDDKKKDEKKPEIKADKPKEKEKPKENPTADKGKNEGVDMFKVLDAGDRMQRKATHQLKEKLTPAINQIFGGPEPKVVLPKLNQGPGVHDITPEYLAQRKEAMAKLTDAEKAALDPNQIHPDAA